MNNQLTKQMPRLQLEFQWNQMLCTQHQPTQLKFYHQETMKRIDKKLENLKQDASKGKEVFLSPKMIYLMSLR